jgi:hypothetical protein
MQDEHLFLNAQRYASEVGRGAHGDARLQKMTFVTGTHRSTRDGPPFTPAAFL